jgi:arylsulfatase A-like enzyme
VNGAAQNEGQTALSTCGGRLRARQQCKEALQRLIRKQFPLVLVALFLITALPSFAEARRRPNVLLIVTDDQRGGLEVMPRTRRWFRSGGRWFPNAYVTTPTCCPSRASIYTGRYAHNHGVRGNFGVGRFDPDTTVYSYLKRAGYRTGLYGKFLYGKYKWRRISRDPPYFDRFAVTGGSTYYNGRWNINGRVRSLSTYSTSVIRRRARRFLRSSEARDETPWFLHVTPIAPHRPFTPEMRYASAHVSLWTGNPAVREEDESDKPRYVQLMDIPASIGHDLRTQQLRTLMSVDDLVSALARTLRSLGETRRTLAIFTSDNGFLWGEHGLLFKDVPYRQAVHVPLFLRWPQRLDRSIDRRLVANIDIAPTVLRAAGLPLPETPAIDGRNLLTRDWRRRRLLLEHWCSTRTRCNRWASIQTKKSQYVEYYRRGRVSFREFYRLRRDPWQLTNLFRDGSRRNTPNKKRLHRRLRRDRACTRRSCP